MNYLYKDGNKMITMCRKNRKWKAVYVNVSPDDLENLGDIVGLEVRKNLTSAEKKKKWVAIDMVDTIKISTDSNPNTGKMTMYLLIYVV